MNIHKLAEIGDWDWPDDAGDILFNVLKDRQAPAGDRLLAAELISSITVMDQEIAHYLLDVARDSSETEEIRGQVLISLGPALEYSDMSDFGEGPYGEGTFTRKECNHIEEQMESLYRDANTPKLVRRRAMESAVRGPAEWYTKAIKEAAAADDKEWQLTAVFCMGYVEGFEKQILQALDNKDPDIFREAVIAAGNWGISEAWPYVNDILTRGEKDKYLLIAAIQAAPGINIEEAESILLDYLESKDEMISEAAEEALSEAGIITDEDEDYLEDDFPEDEGEF